MHAADHEPGDAPAEHRPGRGPDLGPAAPAIGPAAVPGVTRASFNSLPVQEVRSRGEAGLEITFRVPEPLREAYAFRAGQHVSVRAQLDGRAVRRTYSLCGSPRQYRRTGLLRIALRVLPGGELSEPLAARLRAGDRLDVMTPGGTFAGSATAPGGSAARLPGRRVVGIAGGSGIVPVLSVLSWVLETEPSATATLLLANRRESSALLLEDVQDLKDRYLARFTAVHLLTGGAGGPGGPQTPAGAEWPDDSGAPSGSGRPGGPGGADEGGPLLQGRPDRDRLPRLLATFVPAAPSVHAWYVCGPYGLVETARSTLIDLGVPAGRVRTELFSAADVPPGTAQQPAAPPGSAQRATGVPSARVEVAVTLDGRRTELTMDPATESVLDALRRVRPEVPFSCTGGVCGTCRARLLDGAVRMDRSYALEPEEVARGVVLACQAHPTTDRIELSYDG